MVNFFKFAFFNNLVAGLTTIIFTTAIIHPPQIHTSEVNAKASHFSIKIGKVCEKINRAIDKGKTNKIVDYMFDIKEEIEQYTGKKIDISKQIDEAQKQAKSKGQKIDGQYIKQLKKDLDNQDKKRKHRAVWFTHCAELNIPYSSLEADLQFDVNFMINKSAKGEDKNIEVPITVTVGVTLSLCGLFLMFVPIPICSSAGFYLLDTGIGILGSHALQKWDEYDKGKKILNM